MRVYKFLSVEDAIDDLKERRIKISRFEDLNDPFELLSIELSDRKARETFTELKRQIDAEYGVICFSKTWSNPVLWSHYAKNHRGVCLGFDILDDLVIHIQYIEKRLIQSIQEIDEDFMMKLLATKYKHWKYENEVRIFAELKEQDKSGFYFREFDENLALREVVLGARLLKPNIVEEIQSVLQNYSEDVGLIRGRLAFRSFKIVENKLKTKLLNNKIHS